MSSLRSVAPSGPQEPGARSNGGKINNLFDTDVLPALLQQRGD